MALSRNIYTKRNEKIKFKGESLTLTEWAKKLGIKYEALRQRIRRYNIPLEEAITNNKFLQNKKGEESCHWIKDRSKLKTNIRKHYDSRYKDWAKEVKTRDNWKCKINNCDCKGILEAHHILPWRNFPELRYDLNNGITLCKYHHPRSYHLEKKLANFFKTLILKSPTVVSSN
jgi:hypothetical protein